jgi:hypothetical protein
MTLAKIILKADQNSPLNFLQCLCLQIFARQLSETERETALKYINTK